MPTRILGPSDARHDECVESRENHSLFELVRVLRDAQEYAEAFAAYHAAGCPCPMCEVYAADMDVMRDDLLGVTWAMRQAVECLRSATIPPDRFMRR